MSLIEEYLAAIAQDLVLSLMQKQCKVANARLVSSISMSTLLCDSYLTS